MKLCLNCGTEYADKFTCCPECNCEDYQNISAPFWNGIEPYLEQPEIKEDEE